MIEPDPRVVVVAFDGPASALAARLNINHARLVGQLHRHGRKRGALGIEVAVRSDVALRTLRHTLVLADEQD